jgi:hypothetical protein
MLKQGDLLLYRPPIETELPPRKPSVAIYNKYAPILVYKSINIFFTAYIVKPVSFICLQKIFKVIRCYNSKVRS